MPTITNCIIGENGQDIAIIWDEAITSPTLSGSGIVILIGGVSGNANFNYSTGSGTTAWIGTIQWTTRPDFIYLGEIPEIYYLDYLGDLEEFDSGTPLVSFGPIAVTNNSLVIPDTQAPTLSQIEIGTNGRSFNFIFDEDMAENSSGLSDTVNIYGVSIGEASVTNSIWTNSTTLKFSMSKMIFSDEDPSGITFSYASNGITDTSGNTLATFTNRSADVNLSFITYANNQTGVSPKKLYFWTDEDEFEPVNFYNFRREYTNTEIKRIGFLTETDWYPTNTNVSSVQGWTTGESTDIPLNFISSFLDSQSQWDTGTSDTSIDLGVIRNVLRGNVRDINRPFYDTFWLDPEPGNRWWSYYDQRESQSDKDLFWDAMNDINNVYVEELGIETPICWYSTFPSLTGRISSIFDYGGGNSALGWAIQNISSGVLDDTALFGEQTFYPSGSSWGVAFANNISNGSIVLSRFAQNVRGHLFVAYPSAVMLPEGSEYLKTPYTTSEVGSSSGGIALWKANVDSTLELVPENRNRPVIVLLRSKFESHAIMADVASEYTSFQAPFTEEYWKEMIEYLRDHEKVDGVAIFARNISMETDTGDGVTPLDLYTWTAEILDVYNTSFVNSVNTSQNIKITPAPLMGCIPIYSLPSMLVRFNSRKLTLSRGFGELSNPYVLDYTDQERIVHPQSSSWNFYVTNNENRDATITSVEYENFITNGVNSQLLVGARILQGQTLGFVLKSTDIPQGLNTLSGSVTFRAEFDDETSDSLYKITVIYNTVRRDPPTVIRERGSSTRIAPNTYIDEFNPGLNRGSNSDRNRNPGFNN